MKTAWALVLAWLVGCGLMILLLIPSASPLEAGALTVLFFVLSLLVAWAVIRRLKL